MDFRCAGSIEEDCESCRSTKSYFFTKTLKITHNIQRMHYNLHPLEDNTHKFFLRTEQIQTGKKVEINDWFYWQTFEEEEEAYCEEPI